MKKLLLLLLFVMSVLPVQSCERDASCARKIPMYRFSFVMPKGPSWWSQMHSYVTPYIIPAGGIGIVCATIWAYNHFNLFKKIDAVGCKVDTVDQKVDTILKECRNEFQTIKQEFLAVKSSITVLAGLILSLQQDITELNATVAKKDDIDEIGRAIQKLSSSELVEKIAQQIESYAVSFKTFEANTSRRFAQVNNSLKDHKEIAEDTNAKITVLLKISNQQMQTIEGQHFSAQFTLPRFKSPRTSAKAYDATSFPSIPSIALLNDKIWAKDDVQF